MKLQKDFQKRLDKVFRDVEKDTQKMRKEIDRELDRQLKELKSGQKASNLQSKDGLKNAKKFESSSK